MIKGFAVVAIVAGLSVASPPASSQVAASEASRPARPSLTGVWHIHPDPFAGDENLFSELQVPGGGPKLKEPYAAQWKAKRDRRDAMLKAGTPLADTSTLCIPEGMPAVMGAIFPLQFLETPDQIVVIGEFLSQTRRIFIDAPMLADDDNPPSYFGFSSGKWDGNTLVVTTRGVRQDIEFFEIPHSMNMTIVERIRFTSPDLVENEITIHDPDMLVEPYTFTYGYRRDSSYRMSEFLCEREDPLFKVNEEGIVSMKVGEEVK